MRRTVCMPPNLHQTFSQWNGLWQSKVDDWFFILSSPIFLISTLIDCHFPPNKFHRFKTAWSHFVVVFVPLVVAVVLYQQLWVLIVSFFQAYKMVVFLHRLMIEGANQPTVKGKKSRCRWEIKCDDFNKPNGVLLPPLISSYHQPHSREKSPTMMMMMIYQNHFSSYYSGLQHIVVNFYSTIQLIHAWKREDLSDCSLDCVSSLERVISDRITCNYWQTLFQSNPRYIKLHACEPSEHNEPLTNNTFQLNGH